MLVPREAANDEDKGGDVNVEGGGGCCIQGNLAQRLCMAAIFPASVKSSMPTVACLFHLVLLGEKREFIKTLEFDVRKS